MKIDRELVARLYSEGSSIRDISLYVKASPAGVRESLLRSGITLRGHGDGRLGKTAEWNRTLNYEQIVSLYSSGLSIEEVAKRVEASTFGVSNALQTSGVRIRSRVEAAERRAVTALGHAPTKEWLEGLLSDFDGNASAAAAHHNLNYTTLLGHLKRHGIKRLPPDSRKGLPSLRKKTFDVNMAIQMSQSGLSYCEIGLKLGVQVGALIREFKEVGYAAPRGRKLKNAAFRTVANPKRSILNEMGISACEICGETRALDFCHIKAAKNGGPINRNNCLVLCALHHRCFDNGTLTQQEFLLVKTKVRQAEFSLSFSYPYYREW